MADLLVKLYELPSAALYENKLQSLAIRVRRVLPTESATVAAWIRTYFDDNWAEAAYYSSRREPSACFIAVQSDPDFAPQHSYDRLQEDIIGFACYDSDYKGMFGPTGVHPDMRNQGIGAALLVRTLAAMRDEKYAYATIGWAGPVNWYARTVGATVIPNSEPGVFKHVLRPSQSE